MTHEDFYLPSAISKAFGEALAKAQSGMETVIKTAENPAFKRGNKASTYADISSILAVAKPALNAHGIALLMPCVNRDDGCVGAYLELRFGEEVLMAPPFWIKPASGIPHAMISALTYARRAILASYFAIPQEDDDGNTASDHGNSERKDYEPPTRQRPANGNRAEVEDVAAIAAAEALKREEEKKAAAKLVRQAFSQRAADLGFATSNHEALGVLAKHICRKDKPLPADLSAALEIAGPGWAEAIDAAHAELGITAGTPA